MLTLKIKIGKGDFRRTKIEVPKSFESFHAEVTKYLGFENKPEWDGYKILYEDDEGDLIHLVDDADLKEALRQVSETQFLRITVKSDRPSRCPRRRQHSASEHHHAHHHAHHQAHQQATPAACPFPFSSFGNLPFAEIARGYLPQLLNNPALRGIADGMIENGAIRIVTNYICDNCEKQIAGDRYHSTTQEDFDICSACYGTEVGTKLMELHKFERISSIQSLVDCLGKGGTFDAFFKEGKAQEDIAVVHHAICDQCNNKIVGVRNKCIDCPDYDECNVCRPKSTHDVTHKFFTIHDPRVRSIPEDVLAQHVLQKEEAKRELQRKEEEEQQRKLKEEQERKREEQERKFKEEQEELKRASRLVPIPLIKPTAPPKVEEREVSAFEANLKTLESMGFTDRKKNIQVLVRNRNKLFESIQELLN